MRPVASRTSYTISDTAKHQVIGPPAREPRRRGMHIGKACHGLLTYVLRLTPPQNYRLRARDLNCIVRLHDSEQ